MGTTKEDVPENLDTLFNFTMADPELRALFLNKSKEHLANVFSKEASEEIFAKTTRTRKSTTKTKKKKLSKKDRGITDLKLLRESIITCLGSGPKTTKQIKEAIGSKVDNSAYQNAMTGLKVNNRIASVGKKSGQYKTWSIV